MRVLVIAEHEHGVIQAASLSAITAASKIAGSVDVMVLGKSVERAASYAAKLVHVERVLVAEAAHLDDMIAEDAQPIILRAASDYSHILMAATSWGKSVAPRVAAKLNVAQISEITSVVDADTFERPIYAGNVRATVRCLDRLKVLTVRSTAFDLAELGAGKAEITRVDVAASTLVVRFVKREIAKEDRPQLTSADIVVSGGRGLGSGENYQQLLPPLADALNAALGASRAAVDAGFVPNSYQVGQTGQIVAPHVYVAIGISGAIQHLAGMKDSKVIVAINKDADAPIFGVADYGIVGDLFEVVPALLLSVQSP
ncbi:electron transfer flavoprotein subunit alpha/FixB family protein [Caballeronia sp. DA-9]|uniref:electron transfer flavoprotein subunit alpha/FixB family protein n=1 Tax=Caballeronia sp. DA-9 TaxID=3436237 RepID=UPI003F668313